MINQLSSYFEVSHNQLVWSLPLQQKLPQITKGKKGNIIYLNPDDVVSHIKEALKAGANIIQLASEDYGFFGSGYTSKLQELLTKILIQFPSDNCCIVRLPRLNSAFVSQNTAHLIHIMKHPRVFAYIETFPTGSGYDEQFSQSCEQMIKELPTVQIAIDIAENTPQIKELIQRHQFPVLNTKSLEILEIFDSYTTNAAYVGTEQEVWIYGQDQEGVLGRTKNFTQVVLHISEQEQAFSHACKLIGKCVVIKVTCASKFQISGYITSIRVRDLKEGSYFPKTKTWYWLQMIGVAIQLYILYKVFF